MLYEVITIHLFVLIKFNAYWLELVITDFGMLNPIRFATSNWYNLFSVDLIS